MYNGSPVKNIMARIKFSENTMNDPTSFIPHTIEDSVHRPDHIADAYYGDPYYDWIYHFSNRTVDPYHDIFKNSVALNDYIKGKYGTLEKARDTVLYYRNNWINEESITVYVYETLSISLRKYYTPIIDYANQVIGYMRKQVDWITSTNYIKQLTIGEFDATSFVAGDKIYQVYNGDIVAKAELVSSDIETYTIIVKHVEGEFITTAGNTLYGKYGSVGTYSVSVITELNQCIPTDELKYWSPVYAYDFEIEQNEEKRNIFLLRNSIKDSVDRQFTQLLRS